MKDGAVVGWSSVGMFGWGSVVCDPRPEQTQKCERLLGYVSGMRERGGVG